MANGMSGEWAGKVAMVVGAGSGMGRLAAQRWAKAGGVVAACDINEAGLEETASGGDKIHTRKLDVTNLEGVALAVKEIEAELGPLERVYNAAGIQPTQLLLEQPLDEIHRVMAVNYGGLVNVSLTALPPMLERGYGSLINFASIAGWVPNLHFGAYNASKFAAVAFTEVLYHENRGRGVHIACVCPSQVDTPLLAQATSDPQILKTGPAPMKPEKVLDAIDRAVDKDKFWVFPGAHTGMGWRLRRLFPGFLWWIDHRAEGI
jgi:NAD(P)-dependent dehydrogenase (short-subunit alcohol dehydrogenase family)